MGSEKSLILGILFIVFIITLENTSGQTWKFQVDDPGVSPSSVQTGQTVNITPKIKNLSTEIGTVVVELWIQEPGKSSTFVKSEKIYDISVGGTKSVTFSYTPSVEGTYNVNIKVKSPTNDLFTEVNTGFSATKPPLITENPLLIDFDVVYSGDKFRAYPQEIVKLKITVSGGKPPYDIFFRTRNTEYNIDKEVKIIDDLKDNSIEYSFYSTGLTYFGINDVSLEVRDSNGNSASDSDIVTVALIGEGTLDLTVDFNVKNATIIEGQSFDFWLSFDPYKGPYKVSLYIKKPYGEESSYLLTDELQDSKWDFTINSKSEMFSPIGKHVVQVSVESATGSSGVSGPMELKICFEPSKDKIWIPFSNDVRTGFLYEQCPDQPNSYTWRDVEISFDEEPRYSIINSREIYLKLYATPTEFFGDCYIASIKEKFTPIGVVKDIIIPDILEKAKLIPALTAPQWAIVEVGWMIADCYYSTQLDSQLIATIPITKPLSDYKYHYLVPIGKSITFTADLISSDPQSPNDSAKIFYCERTGSQKYEITSDIYQIPLPLNPSSFCSNGFAASSESLKYYNPINEKGTMSLTEEQVIETIENVIKKEIIPASSSEESSSVTLEACPAWVKGPHDWFKQGLIKDYEFKNMIQFLMDKSIVRIG